MFLETKHYIILSIVGFIVILLIILIIYFIFFYNKKDKKIEKAPDIIKKPIKTLNEICEQTATSKLSAFIDNVKKCNRIHPDGLLNQGLPKYNTSSQCVDACKKSPNCIAGRYITEGKHKGECWLTSKIFNNSSKYDYFDEANYAFYKDKSNYQICPQDATSFEDAVMTGSKKCNRFINTKLHSKVNSHKDCENLCDKTQNCLGGIYYTNGKVAKECHLGYNQIQDEMKYKFLENSGNVFFK